MVIPKILDRYLLSLILTKKIPNPPPIISQNSSSDPPTNGGADPQLLADVVAFFHVAAGDDDGGPELCQPLGRFEADAGGWGGWASGFDLPGGKD